MASAFAGDVYAGRSDGLGDAQFLVVLGETDGFVDGVIVTPANRVSPVGERVLVRKDDLAERWDWLETEDNR